MQLSRFTDYSLRVLIYIGLRPDRLVTISEIAQNYCISQNHLVKVVHQLGIHGYIETIRGKGGGIRLARRPELINIGNVVRDTEENMNIAECFDPNKQSCSLLPSCILKSALTEARQSFLATLDFYRLSDFLVNQTALP
ncbi:MAG TPA: Rrf2 family transcriptional regulator, partial [Betaproteobacteria bacterium]|nr:Rrf2 family transcriptional regulator [Betaproteobacteria bacterium]